MHKALDLTYAYSNLGLLRMAQNNLVEAEALFNRALTFRSEIGQLEGVLWGLEGLAVLALKQARYAEAQEIMEEARKLRQAIDAPVLPHTLKFILPKLLSFQNNDSLTTRHINRLKAKFEAVVEDEAVGPRLPFTPKVYEQAGSVEIEASAGLSTREFRALSFQNSNQRFTFSTA